MMAASSATEASTIPGPPRALSAIARSIDVAALSLAPRAPRCRARREVDACRFREAREGGEPEEEEEIEFPNQIEAQADDREVDRDEEGEGEVLDLLSRRGAR